MQIRDRIVELRRVAAKDLRPNPKNWRTHPKAQQEAMRGVLSEIGYAGAVLARQTPEGLMLIDGHLRAEVTPDAEVPVLVLDVDEAEADKLLATYDPLSAMAERDDAALMALLAGVQTNSEAVAKMLDDLRGPQPKAGLTDPDAVPEVTEPITKTGDLWLLGEHRLLCGDSTKAEDVARLMDGAKAAMMFTDPPYGVRYIGGSRPRDAIEGDETCDVAADALHQAYDVLAPGGAAYCFGPAGRNSVEFGAAFIAAGFHFASTLIWAKDNSSFGRADYQWMHEPIIYGWKIGAAHGWYGDRKQTTLWSIPRPVRSEEHPTMKPVDLIERAVGNSSPPYAIVLEPFSGSGSTLIACERLGRRCYAMEIEPKYVDVAVRRWEQYTGREAVHERI